MSVDIYAENKNTAVRGKLEIIRFEHSRPFSRHPIYEDRHIKLRWTEGPGNDWSHKRARGTRSRSLSYESSRGAVDGKAGSA